MPDELDDPPLVLLAPRDRVADLPWLFLEWALAPDRRLLVALAPDPPDPLLMPVEDPDCPPDDVPPLVCARAPALSPRTAAEASISFTIFMIISFACL
ncbi:hypothetical protein [Sphingomonas aerophila]|uniref:Uncharacterized protein n=1 Tax=Sphingomonas aerophila TaxID=1344948 RepID=A0A7W9BGP7_9SPHN|nr:hypothetical protein [Sphingomonas aerophila]MBB5716862.1 hypothetical protein [Sphingomonas aerophila]